MIKRLFLIICLYFFTNIAFASGNNLLVTIGDDKLSDNIERITVLANPGQTEDIYGISLSISITNGEIIDFTPAEFMSIGTCGEGKRLDSNKVCVDFATESGFRDGDELGYITVKWGKYIGKSKIEIKEKNYIGDDGKEFVLSQNTYTYKVYGGIDTTLQRTNIVPFSLVILLLGSGATIFYFVKVKNGITLYKFGLIIILIFSTTISIINENDVGLSKLPETGTNAFTLYVTHKCTSAPDDILEGSFTDTTKTTGYTVEISLYSAFTSKVDSATVYKPTGKTLVPFTMRSSKLASGTKYYIRVKRENPPIGADIYSSLVYFNACLSPSNTPTPKKTNTPIPTKAGKPTVLLSKECSQGKVKIKIIISSPVGSLSGFNLQISKTSDFAIKYERNGVNNAQIIYAPDGFSRNTYEPMPLINAGTYYVRAYRNSDGVLSLSSGITILSSDCQTATPTASPTATPTAIIVTVPPTVEPPTPTDDIIIIEDTEEPEPTFPPEDPTEEPTEIPAPTDTPDPTDIAELTETPIPTVTDTPDVILISDTPFVEISGTLVTPTPQPALVCGPIDHNDDDKLNLFDFIFFSKVYRRKCSDNYPRIACGPKDTNGDGEVGIVDFIYFARHYYTRADSCKLTT